MYLHFDENIPENVKEAFIEIAKRFPALSDNNIYLKKKQIRKSTMQAQPKVDKNFFLNYKRSYHIFYRPITLIHKDLYTKNLPADVLMGWFAHELGHLIDYEDKSFLGMLWFGLKYLVFGHTICEAEKKADLYAIQNGCKKEILAMKEFIHTYQGINDSYLRRIKKYYLGPEEVQKL